MNRPKNITEYDEIDLKLGIKSSLPHVKSTLALAILLWECSDHPAELAYSVQDNNEIVLSDEISQWITDYLNEICEEEQIDDAALIAGINQNQLFKSQMEALIVAFELIWKLSKVCFVDESKAASSERTGRVRYPKKLVYTSNADIIHSLISSNNLAYTRVLMSWMGFDIDFDPECEKILSHLLTALSEGAIFKLTDGVDDIVFNQNCIYQELINGSEPVDINGDKEAKGSLRILKSLLNDGLNPYLQYSSGAVSITTPNTERLEDYQKRVDSMLSLSTTKVIKQENISDGFEEETFQISEDDRVATGENILLYGVPGSGKSWTISEDYCDDESCMERLVFHPDYMYSDFVGQILPIVKKGESDDTEKVRYEFTPGPFTKILKNAYENPSKSFYLIIEEINRGNAPAIFGEIFQLLDRMPTDKIKDNKVIIRECTSEYGITNASIAKEVYGNEDRKIRIPSNLSIIGTMNTSDQNVFTLDTAFQRRWIMRMIPNSFEGHKFGDKAILDTGISWKQFCEAINEEILRRNNVTSSEDKRLGAYFITASDLELEEIPENIKQKEQKRIEHKNARFAEKVLKYLWDDAFKFSHAETFDTKKYKSLEDVIKGFMTFKDKSRFNVFHENLRKLIIEGVEKADNIVLDTSNDAE